MPETITNTPDNNKYLNLYLAIQETKGNPTIEDLKGIVEIVKRDFLKEDEGT